MVVHLLGKEHIEGVSTKTGKPYNISKAFVAYSQRGVDGQKVREILIPYDFDFSKLIVSQHYNFDFDFDGRLANITPVK